MPIHVTVRAIFGAWCVWLALPGSISAIETHLDYEDTTASTHAARVPVSLAWSPNGSLLVAERDAGSLAVIDPTTWTVVREVPLGFRPHQIRVDPMTDRILVGGMDGEFLALTFDGRPPRRDRFGRGPVMVLARETSSILVASRWSRSVVELDRETGERIGDVTLPFPPGAMIEVPGNVVILTDAFQGRLAWIDLDDRPLRARLSTIDGFNLRALGLSGDRTELLIGHMARPSTLPITRTNVDWGVSIASKLAAVRLDSLGGGPGGEERPSIRRLTLDGSGNGAADPSSLALSSDGTRIYLALAGAHQVIEIDRTLGETTTPGWMPLGDSQRLVAVDVGATPLDLVIDPSGRYLVTANAMDDSLSILDLDPLRVTRTVRLSDASHAANRIQRGEAAFRDARLSLDRWMSCATCHPDGHSNGLAFDTQGDGDYGAPKSTPSLLGSRDTAPYAWTGRFPDLEAQVDQSIRTSLHGSTPDLETVAAIVEYLRSLEPPPALRSAKDRLAQRGETVFESRRCTTCHAPPQYTRVATFLVQLGDWDEPRSAYNPPSLRGVVWSAPYFHDGRAETLEDVVRQHHPGYPESPVDAEVEALVAYLESLE